MSSHRFSFWLKYVRCMGFQTFFLLKTFVPTLCGTPNGDYKMGLYRCLLGQAVSRKIASRHLRPISSLDQLVSGRCEAGEKTPRKKMFQSRFPGIPFEHEKVPGILVNLQSLGFIQHVFFLGNVSFSLDSMFLASAPLIYVIYIYIYIPSTRG